MSGEVKVTSPDDSSWVEAAQISDDQPASIHVPLPPDLPLHKLDIRVIGATSPQARSGAADVRVLGIALTSIELESANK
ncbi:hypothetical protein [Dyella silvatica]|uniref:hypothetical protein n=1 Tax=Dyella silvatica TaxID=2992128 RepID=UPI00225B6EE3|nr:hypothetical protein [Dyella silvatica]